MPTGRPEWLVPFLLATLVAVTGCVGSSTSPDETGAADEQAAAAALDLDALWAGNDRVAIVDLHANLIYAFDVLCSSGGGPQLERTGAEVLLGASVLAIELHADPTVLPSFQVGYVLDRNAGYGETQQDNITWLDPVAPGETMTFEVGVPSNGIEQPGAEPIWAFYHRLTPDGETCYTGFATGRWDVVIEAVRGT